MKFLLMMLSFITLTFSQQNNLKHVYFAKHLEGDTVIFYCEYLQTFKITDVYQIDYENNQYFITTLKSGNKIIKEKSIICIDLGN